MEGSGHFMLIGEYK